MCQILYQTVFSHQLLQREVFTTGTQDQNLQSNDIALASIVSGDIKAGVILGSHITVNPVTLAEFKQVK